MSAPPGAPVTHCSVCAQKYSLNLVESTRNRIVFTIFRFILNWTDVCLDLNKPENGKYNLISGWFSKTSEKFLCVYWEVLHDAFKRCTDILVNWRLSVGISTRLASYPRQNIFAIYTRRNLFPIPFKLKEIRSYTWLFSFWLWTKLKSVWFIIIRKTVNTIIFLSIWKEYEK